MGIKYPERPARHALWAAAILVALVVAMIVGSIVNDRPSEADMPAAVTAPVE
jgi:hypothetical protein